MLEIYDRMLKIINPKLYNSPYMVNINEVRNVLDNFRFRSKINFMKNLLTLEIKEMTNEQKIENLYTCAMYNSYENKIYIENPDVYNYINHELFHTASRCYNYLSKTNRDGVIYNCVESFNEGVTEYFYLKSKNMDKSDFDYDLELFVIEILVYIYGEDILIPYFNGNGKKFYRQFEKYQYVVQCINEYLETISLKKDINKLRISYLLFLEIINKENFIDNINEFTLEYNTYFKIQNFYEDNSDLYFKYLDICEKEKLDIYKYNYSDELVRYYDRWNYEYENYVKKMFEAILYNLLRMAHYKELDLENLKKFIIDRYNLKDKTFKDTYRDSLNKILNIHSKKIYIKGR